MGSAAAHRNPVGSLMSRSNYIHIPPVASLGPLWGHSEYYSSKIVTGGNRARPEASLSALDHGIY